MEESKNEKKNFAGSRSIPGSETKDVPGNLQAPARERLEVLTIRNWKEYLGESLLIIFSVILALILTEWFNKLHEERQTQSILRQLRDELITNKKSEEEQFAYHLNVLKKIDSAINDPSRAQKFIMEGKVDLDVITPPPHVVLLHDLNDVAWQVAKQNNIFSKINLSTYSLLTDIYDNQERITRSEEKIASVLLAWESRRPENIRTTLILVRDNYFGWDVQRAPYLIEKYQKAIEELQHE
ncbi:MAG TPA: hypothetical protein VK588_09110 [Chitinophagaceae bacterium]|nr:hypothetical protein [Chitinophagaceae bacterium]